MDVPSFCADVQPFALEGQVAESYSVKRKERRGSKSEKKQLRKEINKKKNKNKTAARGVGERGEGGRSGEELYRQAQDRGFWGKKKNHSSY